MNIDQFKSDVHLEGTMEEEEAEPNPEYLNLPLLQFSRMLHFLSR